MSKDEGIESVSIENDASNITVLAGGVLPLIVNVDLKSSATGAKDRSEFRAGSNETNFETSQVNALEVNSDVSLETCPKSVI